ncbi:hypothetical protein [Methanolapillus ohkumae]|uniref:Uncharacterized protein n=1 Tax=Methanolapillus ohkumae TaxID=3028298 RepID=A0AA96VG10_9EURY|nr:hypothetical protein MsAm2_16250 [Methanosarcinaceae archaeon Am2]
MKNNCLKFVSLLIVLMMTLCLIPTTIAEQNVNDVKVHDLSELHLNFDISSIDASNISEKEATKMSETARLAIEKEIEKEIEASVKGLSRNPSQTKVAQAVTLGRNTSFSTADTLNYSTSKWGVSLKTVTNSTSSTSSKTSQEFAFAYPGVGGCGAWAYVGQKFNVSGSGSQNANIRMIGTISGDTEALGGATAGSKAELVIYDFTTGTSYKETIYNQSRSIAGVSRVNQSFNVGKTVLLQGGHQYVAYLLIEGTASAVVAGEAGSDFGPWDGGIGDPAFQGVKYSIIYIDF